MASFLFQVEPNPNGWRLRHFHFYRTWSASTTPPTQTLWAIFRLIIIQQIFHSSIPSPHFSQKPSYEPFHQCMFLHIDTSVWPCIKIYTKNRIPISSSSPSSPSPRRNIVFFSFSFFSLLSPIYLFRFLFHPFSFSLSYLSLLFFPFLLLILFFHLFLLFLLPFPTSRLSVFLPFLLSMLAFQLNILLTRPFPSR